VTVKTAAPVNVRSETSIVIVLSPATTSLVTTTSEVTSSASATVIDTPVSAIAAFKVNVKLLPLTLPSLRIIVWVGTGSLPPPLPPDDD
jgi:hypothetical protein